MKKYFSNLPLKNGKRNDGRPQSPRLLLMLMVIAMMMLVPSSMKAVDNLYFQNAAWYEYNGKVNGAEGQWGQLEMSSTDYEPISGAKVGSRLRFRASGTSNMNMKKLAFKVNDAEGATVNNYDGSNGWYLRYVDNTKRGLFTGDPNSQLAILDLHPGDIVTISGSTTDADWNNHESNHFRYRTSVHCVQGNGDDIYNQDWTDLTFGTPIYITGDGDLIIQAKHYDTFITQITINYDVAAYKITTDKSGTNPVTTFEFTKDGRLEENDFAIPYMSVTFGNGNQLDPNTGEIINDFIRVNSLKSEIYDINHSEDLKKNNADIPYSGNVYTFKPTGSGNINAYGAVVRAHGENGQYAAVRVFEYKEGSGYTWVNGDPYIQTIWGPNDNVTISFDVKAGYTYYICEDNRNGVTHGAFHMNKFTFENTFYLDKLAKVIDLSQMSNNEVQLTKITGASTGSVKVKRCSGNIEPTSISGYIDAYGFLNLKINQNNTQTFASNADNAGTAILTVKCGTAGEATFVATFPYHAIYGFDEATGRSHGHIWNFIDPRNSDSNIGNCWIENEDGTGYVKNAELTTGILSIGQWSNHNSQLYKEWAKREWADGWSIKDSHDNITDPMYKNVYDMEGDNADMIWETEGLWFDTGTNLSCIYNEKAAVDQSLTNPLDFQYMASDPDRYVGLLSDADGLSSFTIPGLKDGDRVLIFMKSGDKSGGDRETIYLNIDGAGDAIGTPIVNTDLYGVGGTEFIIHTGGTDGRYEGCYHFVKIGDGDMKFTMKRGAIAKLMYIQIYSGKRIDTNRVLRGNDSPLLFLNDEGTAQDDAAGGWYNMHHRGKGENIKASILVHSGNLTDNSFSADKFWYNKTNNYEKTAINFKSTVGEFGVFRLRLMDMDFIHDNGVNTGLSNQGYKYVCDFADRNFTVGYREKMDYPYTWDLTDMMTYSGTDIATENTNYPETTNPYERKGWDISLWDENGYMLIGNEYDADNDGDIFSQNKNGYGNQLYANGKLIPETRGLWFYMDNNYPVYNRCAQITTDGLRFANTADGTHTPDWNYKMVVPSVPQDGAVYLRMKRDDQSVLDTDISNGTPFLATKFHFGVASADEKTSVSTSTKVIDGEGNSGSQYSFFEVKTKDATTGLETGTGEYILAVRNTTGSINHLTFTLNGWIVEKVAVSTDSKKLNERGWATESRNHVIDPELTAYMTGMDIETCIVKNVDYEKKTITLERVYSSANTTNPSLVMSGLADGGTGACIIHNRAAQSLTATDGEIKILNKEFHLFVPDMHDYTENGSNNQKTLTGNSMLVAQVSPATSSNKIPASSGDYTNYALTYKYYQLNPDGSIPSGATLQMGDEAFYRIATGGATSSGNQGYLPLLTSSVNPYSSTYGTNPDPNTNAKFTIVFEDEFEEGGIATAIEEVQGSDMTIETDGYYTLSGTKVNRPTQSGLYIKNGKKVYVK